jgi:hypothetical protein
MLLRRTQRLVAYLVYVSRFIPALIQYQFQFLRFSRHRVLCPSSLNKFIFPVLLLGGHPGINRFVGAGHAIG